MSAVEAESGRVVEDKSRQLSELRKKSYRQFQDGDVVMAKITPCMENGKAAVLRGLKNGVGFGSSEFHVIRPLGGVHPSYILRYVLQRDFRNRAARSMTGTAGQLRVPAEFIRRATIPLAPLAEQRRIVEAIEEQFSRLDSAEVLLQQVEARLTRFKGSVLNCAYSSRSDTVELGSVCTVDSGPAFKSDFFMAETQGVRLVRGENVEPGSLRWRDTKTWPYDLLDGYRHLFLCEQDIILAMDRPIIAAGLKLARVRRNDLPAMLVQRVARIRPGNNVASAYIFFALLQPSFVLHILGDQTGTQLPHITLAGIRRYKLPVPPLDHQQLIVASLEQRFSVMDQLTASIRQSLQRVRQARRSILNDAFTGRLVPQDPDDEPAQTLLERIVAEKVRLPNRKRSKVSLVETLLRA